MKSTAHPTPPREPPDTPHWYDYRRGGQNQAGDDIRDILYRSSACFIFFNGDGDLQWEYDDDLCFDGEASVGEAKALIAQILVCIRRADLRRQALGIVGAALGRALDGRKQHDDRQFFVTAHSFVESIQVQTLHLHYFASSAVATAVVCGLLVTAHTVVGDDIVRQFLLCSMMGALGAFISVSLRFRKIAIEPFSSRLYISIGGVIRICFGAIFGAVFLLLQKSDLLLTVLHSEYGVAAAALVAGFSERLIPDLLAAFESKLALTQSETASG